MAFAVEKGKIAANKGERHPIIDLHEIEPGLVAPISETIVTDILVEFAGDLSKASAEVLRLAQVDPTKLGQVIYVGGSSMMNLVTETMKSAYPDAQHSFTEVFTAVTDGLAIAAGRS